MAVERADVIRLVAAQPGLAVLHGLGQDGAQRRHVEDAGRAHGDGELDAPHVDGRGGDGEYPGHAVPPQADGGRVDGRLSLDPGHGVVVVADLRPGVVVVSREAVAGSYAAWVEDKRVDAGELELESYIGDEELAGPIELFTYWENLLILVA